MMRQVWFSTGMLLILGLVSVVAYSAEINTDLNKVVSEVYVARGDYTDVLPELIQQLEVSAVSDWYLFRISFPNIRVTRRTATQGVSHAQKHVF